MPDAVRRRRVTTIEGEPGSGKSTGVPLALVREAKERGENVSVMVTQPRRLAARKVATRVAEMLGERLGETCGYAVRLQRQTSANTKLMFVTTGWLLQMLAYNPRSLAHVSHIVLDEAHERSVDADFLALIVRISLKVLTRTRIVVMSATLQADTFSRYFSGYPLEGEEEQMEPEPPIHVGSRRFPVEEVYVDELVTGLGLTQPSVLRLAAKVMKDVMDHKTSVSPAAAELTAAICRHVAAPGACVLIFLPGLAEIELVADALERKPSPGGGGGGKSHQPQPFELLESETVPLNVHMLHSSIPEELQELALGLAPDVCKCVLSTNLAESSVTLTDVTHVVDFCLARGLVYNDVRRASAMQLRRASQASLRQRAGRAGRVQAGTAIRLIPRDYFTLLQPHDDAEMQLAPLEETVLQAKLVLGSLGPASELLGRALTPPPQERVDAAMRSLWTLGATTRPDDTGEVTALGKVAARLPVNLRSSRMLLVAASQGTAMIADAVVIAVIASSATELFTSPSSAYCRDEASFRNDIHTGLYWRTKFDRGRRSDLLAQHSVFLEWLDSPRTPSWAQKRALQQRRLLTLAYSVASTAERFQNACSLAGVVLPPGVDTTLAWLSQRCRERGEKTLVKPLPRSSLGANEGELFMLVMLVCTEVQLVSTAKLWPMKVQQKLDASTSISNHDRTCLLQKLPPTLNTDARVVAFLERSIGDGAVEAVMMLPDRNAALVQFAPELDESLAGTSDDVPFAVKWLAAIRQGKRADVFLPNPWQTPPGDPDPAPETLPIGGCDPDGKITWRGFGMNNNLALSDVHCSWRSALGLLASTGPPRIVVAPSVMLFGDGRLGIISAGTLLPEGGEGMLLSLVFFPGAPELEIGLRFPGPPELSAWSDDEDEGGGGDKTEEARKPWVAAVRLDEELLNFAEVGWRLEVRHLSAVDDLRRSLSALATGAELARGAPLSAALADLIASAKATSVVASDDDSDDDINESDPAKIVWCRAKKRHVASNDDDFSVWCPFGVTDD